MVTVVTEVLGSCSWTFGSDADLGVTGAPGCAALLEMLSCDGDCAETHCLSAVDFKVTWCVCVMVMCWCRL